MRALLGPPPVLPRLQSKAPLRHRPPAAQLGTLSLCLSAAPLCVASGGWARRERCPGSSDIRLRAWHVFPSDPPPDRGFGESLCLKA